jgi:anti-sigma factor RsiW
MHEPIQQGLEEFLSGRSGAAPSAEFQRHLAECAGCRSMVEEMRAQQALLRQLRAPEIEGPAPGFYARVMERIEAQAASNSFWSIFLEPSFGRRLLYASLALSLVLGAAVWRTPGTAPIDVGNPVQIMAGSGLPAATGEDPGRDREVVLTNLVSLNDGGAAPDSLPISSD